MPQQAFYNIITLLSLLACLFTYLFIYLRFYLFTFRAEGRETNIDVPEKHRLVAPCTPPIGPTTQACHLKGNQTSDLSVCGQHPTPWATPFGVCGCSFKILYPEVKMLFYTQTDYCTHFFCLFVFISIYLNQTEDSVRKQDLRCSCPAACCTACFICIRQWAFYLSCCTSLSFGL